MITIYGRPGCGFCDKAKILAAENDIAYDYRDVYEGDNMRLMREVAPDAKTVPQIVGSDGEYIGGYQDFYNKFLAGDFT